MVEVKAMDPAQEFEAKLLARNKAMDEATKRGDSPVQQFYSGAVVFVTGGSGFLGKQLIEKLFRATKISKVFILLRSKKGKAIQQRLNEMLQDPVYDIVRDQQPDFVQKIVPVEGDVAELRLGMSDKDWNMVAEQVEIIFHMAATTRFDESLRVATMINVRGTREALLLGKDCKKLKSFIHVSTAYSHACDNRIDTEVLEDFYKSPVDPDTLIRLAETIDEDRLNDITGSLIKNWPNTYSFAKAVAEESVRNLREDLPICVVRPAIVVCAKREPNPGWVDISNVYGASGIILGSGLGLMHVVMCDDSSRIGLIPVDYVNNVILAAGWDTVKRRAVGDNKIKIYTVTTSTSNHFEWRKASYDMENGDPRYLYPSPAIVWHPYALRTPNKLLFWLFSWILHFIPAYIIDGICSILGKERRFVKLYTKMYKMSIALSYFTVNQWKFDDKNTLTLYDSLSPIDREIFEFDVKKIDWTEYMNIWCIGLRKYIVKDGLKGSKYAVKKLILLKILLYITNLLYAYLLFKILHFGYFILSLFVNLFY